MKAIFTTKAFNLTLGVWRFNPSWFMLIGFILGLLLFLTLSQWQLDRAEEKQNTLLQIEARMDQAPEVLEYFELSQENLAHRLYQPVSITGQWRSNRALIQDNVTRQGVSGYQVIVPLQLEMGQMVLVDLGWQAWGLEKTLPDLRLPEGKATIEGIMAPFLKRFSLSDAIAPDWPKIIQQINPKQMAVLLDAPVVPMHLLQQAPETGFNQERQLVFGDPDKHRAYALQWGVFAFILCLLFLGLNLKALKMTSGGTKEEC